MAQFTSTQVDIIRRHVAENPDQSPTAIAGYFERVADLDQTTALSIATVAMLLREGRELEVAQYIDYSSTVRPDDEARTRYANALIGGAAGDAWGYQVEFTSYPSMPSHPVAPPEGDWIISDDTQMLLATHAALHECPDLSDIDTAADTILRHFIVWSHDPDNNRAPGVTCMNSLRAIERGRHWNDGGARNSAGCGAVMRLTPAAFAPKEYRRGISVLQAVVTHHHPKAALSALLLCDAFSAAGDTSLLDQAGDSIRILRSEMPTAWRDDRFLNEVLSHLTSDPHAYLSSALGNEPGRRGPTLADAFEAARQKAADSASTTGWLGDPCAGIGEGWDAATATALGLLIADLNYSERLSPVDAIGWAATSNGDSDSIATLAGALIGAAHAQSDFWQGAGLCPRFESRYSRELTHAAEAGPAGSGK